MAELNKLKCLDDIRNTGHGGCPLEFGAIVGEYLVPKGKVFTSAELDTLEATLRAAVLAAKAARIYPVSGFEVITNNTPAPTFQTLASGRQILVQEADYDWTFQYVDGGLCLSNKLRSFKNNKNFDVLYFDADNKLFGRKAKDADGEWGLGGIPLRLNYPYPWTPNDFANAPIYQIRQGFNPRHINEDIGYVEADFDLKDIKGLQNINLRISGTPAGGVYQVIAETGCEAANIYDFFATELASATLWKMYNVTTGAEITLDSVAGNAAIKGFTITADEEDTDYVAATATGMVRIELVTPALLHAADVSGFEGIPVEVVRGA